MRLKNFLLLLMLASLWGPSFLFIKVAVAEIPPFTLVLARVGIAALFLYTLLRLNKRALPAPGRVWLHLAIVALFHNALPFALLSWGEQRIDSALASIINGMTPIFTILIAHLLTSDDRLSPTKVGGVMLGMAGMVLLVAPSLLDGVQATTLGLLAVVFVSASYGLALVYSRQKLRGLPPLVAPTSQMLLATLYLLPLSLLFDRPFSLPAPSLAAAGSILALALLTTIAFIVYYRLVQTADASYASMVTYLAPIFGVLLGVMVLGERLAWNAFVAFALILLGVMVVNGVFRELPRPRPIRCWPAHLRALVTREGTFLRDGASPC
jgi:drug/metabolite transporter (DMT)-like permease